MFLKYVPNKKTSLYLSVSWSSMLSELVRRVGGVENAIFSYGMVPRHKVLGSKLRAALRPVFRRIPFTFGVGSVSIPSSIPFSITSRIPLHSRSWFFTSSLFTWIKALNYYLFKDWWLIFQQTNIIREENLVYRLTSTSPDSGESWGIGLASLVVGSSVTFSSGVVE